MIAQGEVEIDESYFGARQVRSKRTGQLTLTVFATCFSAKPEVAEMGEGQKQTAGTIEDRSRIEKISRSLVGANRTNSTVGQWLGCVKGILVNRNPYDTSQAQHAENRNEFVFVLAAAHEHGEGSCGYHQKDHPKMKVFMNPKSGGNNGKEDNENRRQQAVHGTDYRHADGQRV